MRPYKAGPPFLRLLGFRVGSRLALLIFGASGFLWRIYAPNPWDEVLFRGDTGGFILLSWKGREVLDFLKSHVTYARTGYVQSPEESATPQTLITLSLRPGPPADENVTSFQKRTVMVIWWFLFILAFNQNPQGRWLVPLGMPALAATLYAVNRSSERPYRWWSALILALTGLVFLWVDLPPLLQPLLPVLLAGGWLIPGCLATHAARDENILPFRTDRELYHFRLGRGHYHRCARG